MKVGACAAMDTTPVFCNIFEDAAHKYTKNAPVQISILGTHF